MVRQFRMHGANFYSAIHDTVFATAKEPMRFGDEMKMTMECVKLEFTEGQLLAVASDGRRIATRQVDCDYGEYDGFETLIYRKNAKSISKKFKSEKEVLGIIDGDMLTLKTETKSDSVYHRPHDEYAKWRQVIPNDFRIHRTLSRDSLKDALEQMYGGITDKMISHDRRCVRMVFEAGDDNTVLWLEPTDTQVTMAQNTIGDWKAGELPQAMQDLAQRVPQLVQPIPRIEDTFHVYISPTYLLEAMKAMSDDGFTFAHNYDNDSTNETGDIYEVLHAITLLPTPYDTSKPYADSEFLHMIMPMRPQ